MSLFLQTRRGLFPAVIFVGALTVGQQHRQLRCDYQPRNKAAFPRTLWRNPKSQFVLIASGTRKVTFLSISVYDVGIYLDQADIPLLNSLILELQLHSPKLLRDHLMDPVKGSDFFDKVLDKLSFIIRLSPVRNTDVAHIRDGFLRGILLRQDPPEEALQHFKEAFPNPRKSLLKDSVMAITIWKEAKGGMEIDLDGHDYGRYTGRDSRVILNSFLSTYLSGQKVADEAVRREFIEEICREALGQSDTV